MATLPTASELKKLAAACRKAGIKHFKCGDVEFTLSDEAPVKSPSKKAAAGSKQSELKDKIPSTDDWDSLSPEQQMFYSVGGLPLELDLGGTKQ